MPENQPTGGDAQPISQSQQAQIKSLEDDIRKGERWIIFLTGAIAIFSFFGVVVGLLQWSTYNGQLDVMRGQLKEMRDTSMLTETRNLAKSAADQVEQLKGMVKAQSEQAASLSGQLNIAHRQLENSTRPWLVIDDAYISSGNSLVFRTDTIMTTIKLAIRNIGHSPATNLWVHAQLQYEGGPMAELVRGTCKGNGAPVPDSGFGDVIFPDRPSDPTMNYMARMPDTQVAKFWSQQHPAWPSIDVFGCVAYRGADSKRLYYTGFDYQIMPTGIPPSLPASIPGQRTKLMPSQLGFIVR